MSRIEIKPELIKWALSRARITKEDLMLKYPDRFIKFDSWLSGTTNPTINQLQDFANVTATPFGYLFLEKPPEEKLELPFYRTLQDEAQEYISTDLRDVIFDVKTRQTWIRDLFIEEGYDKLSFVGSVKTNLSIIECANQVKSMLHLSNDWASKNSTWEETLQLFRQKIEELGIFIVTSGVVRNNTNRKLNVSEFRGFVVIDDYAPFIFVNGSDVKAAQMFTLIHELIHVLIGENAIFDLREMKPSENNVEQYCNNVAAEFLVPGDVFKNLWNNRNNKDQDYSFYSKHFKVSEIVIARKALDLNLINKNSFFEFYNNYISKEYLKKEQLKKDDKVKGNFYNNQNYRVGKKFMNYILYALKKNKLLYTEAYELTGLYGTTFDNYTNVIEGNK